ncbi:glycoside hydrolase family 5 protein [Endozoicomonas sp. OPT23]|uniref:glycoside hydrolase family 5 protein n=1 Tax=Endozoicomonas sp. OPT23 TaxID=2072845 RepID=UPI001E596BF9|nr:cellulase family glycosylhydrolase [Endozoicomonas sp. OPT23]
MPRAGTNQFNQVPEQEWFEAAAAENIEWVRITFSKWNSKQKDFLAGDLDNYQQLVKKDLATLKKAIGWAEEQGLKVVIAPLGLPGSRWTQNNQGKKDQRLWNDKKWWQASARYWQDLARALKDSKAVVAYNIINEPKPEFGTGLAEHGDPARYKGWYEKYQGTSHDLPEFYNTVISAIRAVDAETPVMVDAGWYGQAQAFVYWPKLKDAKVLYSFHMYEPFNFTSRQNYLRKRKGKELYSYPGLIPYAGKVEQWDKKRLTEWFTPFNEWAEKNSIPANRIVAAEFGAYRRVPGGGRYMEDLLELFDQKQYHWAFYSFREDEWDGYDYEIGNRALGWKYWEAKEKGEDPEPPRDESNPLWQVLDQALETRTRT